jgi:hypothetical protein
VVDPLDGTKEFVAGRPGFGVMAALVETGTTTAAWIYLPTSDRLFDGALGTPVRRNGIPIPSRVSGPPPGVEHMKGFALTRLAPPVVRAIVDENMRQFPALPHEGSGTAALAYADLWEGQLDFGFYWRTLPWDHAPGAFLVRLAGGQSARLDGEPYAPGDDRTGLLVTTRKDRWAPVLGRLSPGDARTEGNRYGAPSSGQADNGRVAEQSNYAVSLTELEKTVHVASEDMIEAQAVSSLHEYVDPAELDRNRLLSPTGDGRLSTGG